MSKLQAYGFTLFDLLLSHVICVRYHRSVSGASIPDFHERSRLLGLRAHKELQIYTVGRTFL